MLPGAQLSASVQGASSITRCRRPPGDTPSRRKIRPWRAMRTVDGSRLCREAGHGATALRLGANSRVWLRPANDSARPFADKGCFRFGRSSLAWPDLERSGRHTCEVFECAKTSEVRHTSVVAILIRKSLDFIAACGQIDDIRGLAQLRGCPQWTQIYAFLSGASVAPRRRVVDCSRIGYMCVHPGVATIRYTIHLRARCLVMAERS